MKVAHVLENHTCVGKILVDVVEVGEHYLSPGIEMIECLFTARNLLKTLVEVADEFNRVGNDKPCVAAEELADGEIGGSTWVRRLGVRDGR